MTTVPYISIKSVLYDLSRLIPESQWNETDFLEWATKGLRRTKIYNKLQSKVCYIALESHKATLPSDLRYLTQILYKAFTEVDQTDIDEIRRSLDLNDVEWTPAIIHMDNPSGLATDIATAASNRFIWRPLKPATNTFFQAIACTPSLFPQLEDTLTTRYMDCDHEFIVDAEGVITCSLTDAVLAVSYLRYPKDEDLNVLIPDHETLKEALVNYCLWMYYTKKDILGEPNLDKKIIYYKQMFGHMASKAASELNSPDLAQMETIKDILQRLVPRANQAEGLFSKLNNKEDLRW